MLTFELLVFFALLSLGASFVNGAIGYGYSSISTPLALLVLVNRLVNPAYVFLEAMINTIMGILSGKKNFKATFRRTLPTMLAIAPGAILGSLVLAGLSSSYPNWAKFLVYGAILPLIFLQALGMRRAIKREKAAGVPLGFGIGLIYSLTTISGPPIALFWNNQGMSKEEFKASVSQVRITESYITCVSYYFLGFFGASIGGISPIDLFYVIAPPVLIGLPLGVFAVKHLNVETFRRVAMSFNAWIVGYGLTRVLMILFGLNVDIANVLFTLVVLLSTLVLYRYFKERRAVSLPIAPPLIIESNVSGKTTSPSNDGSTPRGK